MAAMQVSSSLTDHVSGDSVTVTTENSFSSAKTIKIENLNTLDDSLDSLLNDEYFIFAIQTSVDCGWSNTAERILILMWVLGERKSQYRKLKSIIDRFGPSNVNTAIMAAFQRSTFLRLKHLSGRTMSTYEEPIGDYKGSFDEQAVFIARNTITDSEEMATVKLEMGMAIGFQLHKRVMAYSNPQDDTQDNGDSTRITPTDPKLLQTVKFLSKQIWGEVFGQRVDKLRANHRGAFQITVLEIQGLTRLPPSTQGRVDLTLTQVLAFPCGLIKGVLATCGISATVTCQHLHETISGITFSIDVNTN